MLFGNNLIDFNSIGIKQPSKTIFQAQSLMRVVDDNVDWQTGAILDDDGVVFTQGENNPVPETATLLRERELTTYAQVRYEDATDEERATALDEGNVYYERDTNSQAHQDLFDGMGLYTGVGEMPNLYGEGVGGEGTNTFIRREESIFVRAWCLIGDCSEVNTNTQQQLDLMDNDGEDDYCYDENDEYICDDDGNLISDSGSGSSGGIGMSGMTQADEEQLADKADETHISGGNESMSGMMNSAENNSALIGILLLGAGYGAYKYENETSFFSKNYKKLMNKIKQ
tara:strand:+ start:1266 stop:2120 length:855 start_codon:yes stop_codon:yes gene_type:complete